MTTSSFLNIYSWCIDAVIALAGALVETSVVQYERWNAVSVSVWISVCEETSFAVFYDQSINGLYQKETYLKTTWSVCFATAHPRCMLDFLYADINIDKCFVMNAGLLSGVIGDCVLWITPYAP